jgi:hypothetical protein
MIPPGVSRIEELSGGQEVRRCGISTYNAGLCSLKETIPHESVCVEIEPHLIGKTF